MSDSTQRDASGYDYIVVGSGAGGGPLAARLALAGKRVLVIEAGSDSSQSPPTTPDLEVSQVPSFHGISTEHPDLSWRFFVKHYDNPPTGRDPKWHTPGPGEDPKDEGIFYPRAAALGGCTVHNAMITISGPDSDWDDLADFLKDDSWRGMRMRAYFTKLEHNDYSDPPTPVPTSWWGRAWDDVKWLFGHDPDHSRGGHGFNGWLHTSMADVSLGLTDKQLITVLKAALTQSKLTGLERAGTLIRRFLKGEISQSLDPNHARTKAESPEGLALIPLAVCGNRTTIHQNRETPDVKRGRRSSPREFLLEAKARCPDNITFLTDCLVTKVLFDDGDPPKAVGLDVLKGKRLYKAHPFPSTEPGIPEQVFVKEGGEIILCGGSFNTPQLLMLSGIGDVAHLENVPVDSKPTPSATPDANPHADANENPPRCCLHDRDGHPLRDGSGNVRRIHSPGVGRNLQDRYEVTVISEMNEDFSLLRDATFSLPNPPENADPQLREWRESGTGLYTSNGAVLAILKRSRPDLAKPDLFIFGIPLPFRGYEVGYSKNGDQHNFFTWAILKAQTRNHDGTVKLVSGDPLERPDINFHYFNETSRDDKGTGDPDLAALLDGVKFVRGIAEHADLVIKGEHHPGLTSVSAGNDDQIKNWIQRDAWGHHACGTCRMGPDGDEFAVLDSRFRVRGNPCKDGIRRPIPGLRVVDASVFPKIPGYFIVANVYMVSEKAADDILADAAPKTSPDLAVDSPAYPVGLRKKEACAIRTRREQVVPTRFKLTDGSLASLRTETVPEKLLSNLDRLKNKEFDRQALLEELKDILTEGELKTYQERIVNHARIPNDDLAAVEDGPWPDDVTGLAISGGGIRSATLGLGILQSLAEHRWLPRIDFLSTVSGGGYIGSFLGRFYDRFRATSLAGAKGMSTRTPAEQVEEELTDPASPTIDWLRKHGNYLAPGGKADWRLDIATYLRNFLSVHFVVGMLIFTLFGLANAVRYGLFDPATAGLGLVLMSKGDLPLGHLLELALGPFFSPWFTIFELCLLFYVVPRVVGYWIVSPDRNERFHWVSLTLLYFVAAVLLLVGIQTGGMVAPLAIGLALFGSFVPVERAWRRGREMEAAVGNGGAEASRMRTRNYLTFDLGLMLSLTGLALGFAVIDTLGHGLQQWLVENNVSYAKAFVALGGALTALIPIVRMAAGIFAGPEKPAGPPSTLGRIFKQQMVAGTTAVVLLVVPLVSFSFAAHAVFQGGTQLFIGILVTLFAAAVSFILCYPAALTFVNRSSLGQLYSDRLARAFLGASNPLRHRPEGANITEVIAGDDVSSIREYQPHEAGGPLHLINVVINQTVDFSSQRGNLDRQGESLAVSSIGVNVGTQWHGLWTDASDGECHGRKAASKSRLVPVGYTADDDHPLIDENGAPAARTEMLSLRQWTGISGAAVGPAQGHYTALGTALLFGLANVRTGYWWDSGITDVGRDGFPRLTFLRRFLYLLPRFFQTQALLLFEWTARFPGPWERFWNLSDGGYFENTGGYELVRRRVPRIIVCDGTTDATYDLEAFADFVRKVRIDFNASVVPFSAKDLDDYVPASVRDHVGTPDQLRPVPGGHSARHATLYWVKYESDPARKSVVLYLKASVTGDETADVQNYQSSHPEFPHESTGDQVFNEPQWESYRKLGQHLSCPIFSDKSWFWKIPLN
jgi:choline dehydrogenase-like flavoprotein